MGRPAHRFLEEFPSEVVTSQPALLGLRSRPAAPPPPDPFAVQLADAYERGLAEGRIIERSVVDAEIARLSLEYEQKLADVRNRFADDLIERMAADLGAGLDRERARLGDRLGAAMAPVLCRVLSAVAIRDFSAELCQLLGASTDVIAELSGPDDLLARIAARLEQVSGSSAAAWFARIRVVPSDDVAVRVRLGDATIEMRLHEWLARIEEAVL